MPGVSAILTSSKPRRGDAPSNTTAAQGAMRSLAERQDLLHVAAFFRRARLPAVAGWLVWVPFDIALTGMYPGTLPRSLLLRALSFVAIMGCLEAVVRARSYHAMTAWLVALGVAINGGIASIGAALGGVQSPYNPGSVVFLAVMGFCPLPWRRVLPVTLAAWAVYPAALVLFAAFDAVQCATLRREGALLSLAVSSVVGLTVAALATIGASLSWTLRQQVFESRSIGRYQLRRRLGVGGMGEVWAAWHRGLQREVALKILRAPGDPEQAAARFEREVRAMTELTHPNTVRVFDFGATDDGITYYAMELLVGETLVELVAREGPLPAARAVYLVAQASRALAEAHARGLVHRDVKPENLFVTVAGGEPDFVKVLDFGIVRREAEAASDNLTKTGSIAGTPAYLAPEVVRGEAATARADVYALGAVLYFLLTGRHAFTGDSVVALLLAQLNDPVTPPSVVLGRPVAADLEALVMRCLSKDPLARPADAGELADALGASSVSGAWRPAVAAANAGLATLKPGRSVVETAATVEAPRVV